MKKIVKSVALGLACCSVLGLGGVFNGSFHSMTAEDTTEKVYIQETFDGKLNGWTAKGFHSAATATVKNGALIIDASLGAQELTLPKLPSADFVLTMQATRLQEESVTGDDIDSFSVKYGIQEDSSGYEVELNVLQKDKNAGFYYYGNQPHQPDADGYGPYTLHAAEYRYVAESNVETGVNKSRIDGFTFLAGEIEMNQAYTYTMVRIGKEMQFYVNGEMIFHQVEKSYKDGAVALRVAEGMKFSFDNLTVYSKEGYAEALIDDIGLQYEESWTKEDAEHAEKALKRATEYIQKYNVDVMELVGGADYVQAKAQYEAETAPTLTVSGKVDKTYAVGDKLTLPTATATDYKGNALAVYYELLFDDKNVRIENGEAQLNEKGTYNLRVWTRDVYGVITEKIYTLTVEETV